MWNWEKSWIIKPHSEKLKEKGLKAMRAEINSLENQLKINSMGKMNLAVSTPRTAWQLTCFQFKSQTVR